MFKLFNMYFSMQYITIVQLMCLFVEAVCDVPWTLTINQSSSLAGAVSSSIFCTVSSSSGWEDPNR